MTTIIPVDIVTTTPDGITYIVCEIEADKHYGIFSLTGDEASDGKPAVLEAVHSTVAGCLKTLNEQLNPKKKRTKVAAAEPTPEPPARTPRKKAKV